MVVVMEVWRLVVPEPFSCMLALQVGQVGQGAVGLVVLRPRAATEFVSLDLRCVLVTPLATAEADSATTMVTRSFTWLARTSRPRSAKGEAGVQMAPAVGLMASLCWAAAATYLSSRRGLGRLFRLLVRRDGRQRKEQGGSRRSSGTLRRSMLGWLSSGHHQCFSFSFYLVRGNILPPSALRSEIMSPRRPPDSALASRRSVAAPQCTSTITVSPASTSLGSPRRGCRQRLCRARIGRRDGAPHHGVERIGHGHAEGKAVHFFQRARRRLLLGGQAAESRRPRSRDSCGWLCARAPTR